VAGRTLLPLAAIGKASAFISLMAFIGVIGDGGVLEPY
jgi:hypothetical protein